MAVPALKVADFFIEPGSIRSLCRLWKGLIPEFETDSGCSTYGGYIGAGGASLTHRLTVLPLPSYIVFMYPTGAARGPLAIRAILPC